MLSSRLSSPSDFVEVGLVEAGFSSLLVCVGGGCSGTVKNIQVLSNTVIVYIHPRQVSNFWLKLHVTYHFVSLQVDTIDSIHGLLGVSYKLKSVDSTSN